MERPCRVLETYRRSLRPFLPQIPTNAATHWVHILEYEGGGPFISWSKGMKCIVNFRFCVCCILGAGLVIWNTISASCQKWRTFCLVLHFCVNCLHGIRHTTSAFGSLHMYLSVSNCICLCFNLYLCVWCTLAGLGSDTPHQSVEHNGAQFRPQSPNCIWPRTDLTGPAHQVGSVHYTHARGTHCTPSR